MDSIACRSTPVGRSGGITADIVEAVRHGCAGERDDPRIGVVDDSGRHDLQVALAEDRLEPDSRRALVFPKAGPCPSGS